MKRSLYLAFGVSGAVALMYEVVWVRYFQIVFGSTIYTTSVVFATFLLGFTLGSWIFGSYAEKFSKKFLTVAILQIVVGVYGIFLVIFLKISPDGVEHFISLPLKIITCVILLIVPVTCFGALWPLIYSLSLDERFLKKERSRIGDRSGRLYFVNAFGSALGAFVSGFIFIPLFGFMTTSVIASLCGIVMGLWLLRYKNI